MKVMFLPIGKQIESEKEICLMDIMRELDTDVDFVCGGNGTCGKCRVLVTKGNDKILSESEKQHITEEERMKGYRLACKFIVREDTCVILEHTKLIEAREKLSKEVKYDEKEYFSVAVDLGTTTIEAAFLDSSNNIVKVMQQANPQRDFGLDVIARLTFSLASKENEKLLSQKVKDCIESMCMQFCMEYGTSMEKMKKIVVLGNSTMISIFLNLDLEGLAKYPFGVDYNGNVYKGSQVGFSKLVDCDIILPALIGGHVGSDTLGCIVATELYQQKGTHLLVDIGTNGEIVLLNNGKITVCSTAAGPAFEGGGIRQGMRAKTGAIWKVKLEGDTIKLFVVGGGKPFGICGSGLLDAIYVLLVKENISSTGHLVKEKVWLDAERRVALWQEDIRQVQLAKAAIYTGMKTLLKSQDMDFVNVDKLWIAGAFGSNLSLESACGIGLLPKMDTELVKTIGNGSLQGGIKLLRGEITLEKMDLISKDCRHLELAQSEIFREEYIKQIDFSI